MKAAALGHGGRRRECELGWNGCDGFSDCGGIAGRVAGVAGVIGDDGVSAASQAAEGQNGLAIDDTGGAEHVGPVLENDLARGGAWAADRRGQGQWSAVSR